MKVLDFGLAVIQPPESESSVSDLETRLTAPGAMVGTSGYVSPEQIRGDDVDARTDIFSFGIVLYEMLVGRHPFLRQTPADTLSAILRDPPPPTPWLPARLRAVLARCLAKSPEERWPSVEELEAGLREAPPKPRPVLRALTGWLRRS